MRFFVVVSFALCASSCGGVDFAGVVDGNVFGRAGSFLTRSAQVVVDFSDADVVTLDAFAKDGDTVTDSGSGVCDRGDVEEGLFETKLSTTNCEFTYELTTEDPPEESPTELVVGFKNAEEDGSVEIDPSLEGDLPFPLSFADSYARLKLVDE